MHPQSFFKKVDETLAHLRIRLKENTGPPNGADQLQQCLPGQSVMVGRPEGIEETVGDVFAFFFIHRNEGLQVQLGGFHMIHPF